MHFTRWTPAETFEANRDVQNYLVNLHMACIHVSSTFHIRTSLSLGSINLSKELQLNTWKCCHINFKKWNKHTIHRIRSVSWRIYFLYPSRLVAFHVNWLLLKGLKRLEQFSHMGKIHVWVPWNRSRINNMAAPHWGKTDGKLIPIWKTWKMAYLHSVVVQRGTCSYVHCTTKSTNA